MKVVETNFTDAKLLEPRLFEDERGFLLKVIIRRC